MNEKELYHKGADFQFEHDEILLGAPSSYSLSHDAKHLAFVLSRYKFCARILQGKKRVLEIGCGDGIGLPLIAQAVKHVYCVDWEERPLKSISNRLLQHIKNVTPICLDPTKQKLNLKVDAAFSIDFIEHINSTKEYKLLKNIVGCLPDNGVLITGTPNITAKKYASPCSAIQHINLKSMESLKELMQRYFENVFMFGMNDEVLHTGFAPMCNYIWSVAAGLKKRKSVVAR
jgi:2-polyprenyl-3-methyl-5-hydroxy-6-metoxy-1,4-benzoquinol methylase